MNGLSQSPIDEKIKVLRALMPEVFDEGKIDWEKLKAILGENIRFANERYVLNWAGKSDAFRIMQQQTSATLTPCREESVEFDTTQNLFIEGENMEVLKVLQKSYFDKVKMIYIDPPYNTGNDSFIYPDKFSESKEDYLRRVGDKDEEGYMTREGLFRKNSKENGQYHSNWLSMMMPRLYLAKNLLREDGVIFISIDDNEVHNLRLLMNEIFGEENFLATISRRTKTGGGSASHYFAVENDFILVYAKNTQSLPDMFAPFDEKYLKRYAYQDDKGRYFWDTMERSCTATIPYKIKAPDGTMLEGNWFRSEQRFWEDQKNGEIRFIKKENGQWSVQFKQRMAEGKKVRTLFFENDFKSSQDDLITLNLENVFSFPKPIYLIKYLLSAGSDKDSIILDFFAGSGTTAHAVMQLNKEDGGNRKFICVQLPELCEENSEAYKAGYRTIADISKERIRRASAKIRAEIETEQAKQQGQLSFEETSAQPTMPDLGFKVFKLSSSNFKEWRPIRGSHQDEWIEQQIDFINPIAEHANIDHMVYELLLKSGKDLNSKILHEQGFYTINDNDLVLLLEDVNQEMVNTILSRKPNKVIALDNLFQGNDQLKTNTALQMRDAGVEFKTI